MLNFTAEHYPNSSFKRFNRKFELTYLKPKNYESN